MASQHKKGVIGERHGTLTAVKPTEKRYYGQSVWLWRCDCGEEVERTLYYVRCHENSMCPTCAKKAKAERFRRVIAETPRYKTGCNVGVLKSIRSGTLYSNNTTGSRNVHYLPKINKWRVDITFAKKLLCFGLYDSIEDAKACRDIAIKELYDENSTKDPEEIAKDIRERLNPRKWVSEDLTATGIVYTSKIKINGKLYSKGGFATQKEAHEWALLQKSIHQIKGGHFKNISGERFGTLTAVRPTDKKDNNGNIIWLWRCDCGEEFEQSLVLINRKNPACPTCTKKMRTAHGRCALAAQKRDGENEYDLGALENLCSGNLNANNSSGTKYVYYLPKKNKWRVMLNFEQRYIHVGIFDSLDEAVAQRDEAIKQLYARKKDEKEILEDLREQRTPHRWVRERMTNTGIVYAGEINIKGKRYQKDGFSTPEEAHAWALEQREIHGGK